ncbi:zinc-dependent alcohol dehydrogenase [Breznakiella homolactica]|uniref:Alcohol dehydrogenase catalytic domain-containing protein n=1 Tax=Breznakiella homolactica TaxID=2798577 RepID=A0A7T7XR56_9SPIR|nr:alcohol dehydrogenase catalytic domain-containing protein [Breznakiella homolactica]QQO10980.1 alcohol dehydrogenase catalytic domain-containing protein [Breznakiella homolactica]
MPTKMKFAEFEYSDDFTAPGTQRVAILEKPFRMKVVAAKIPEPSDDELRIKIKYVGICGSDLEAYRGNRKPEFISFPSRLGHEVAGTIDKVGKNIRGLKPGQKVTCRYVWGAYAEYIVCRPFNVQVVPDDFDMKDISLIEILPGVIHAAELSQCDSGRTVLITGQGVSGLVLTQVMALYSPKELVVTDTKDRNLELAKKYGATRTYKIPSETTPTMDILEKDFPDGFDIVIPCLLEGASVADAMACARTAGKIVMYGGIGICHEELDFFKVHRMRLEILATEPKRDIDMYRYFKEGIALVKDGLVNTGEFIDRIYPLSEIQEAFDIRNDKSNDVIHILVDAEN